MGVAGLVIMLMQYAEQARDPHSPVRQKLLRAHSKMRSMIGLATEDAQGGAHGESHDDQAHEEKQVHEENEQKAARLAWQKSLVQLASASDGQPTIHQRLVKLEEKAAEAQARPPPPARTESFFCAATMTKQQNQSRSTLRIPLHLSVRFRTSGKQPRDRALSEPDASKEGGRGVLVCTWRFWPG